MKILLAVIGLSVMGWTLGSNCPAQETNEAAVAEEPGSTTGETGMQPPGSPGQAEASGEASTAHADKDTPDSESAAPAAEIAPEPAPKEKDHALQEDETAPAPETVTLPPPRIIAEDVSIETLEYKPRKESDNPLYIAYKYAIRDHLAFGARVTEFTLEDDSRPTREDSFLGSITKLEAEQDDSPRFFVNYKLCRYLGLGITWNELRAETITHVREEGIPGDMHTDGTIDMSGTLYYLTARLPNRTRFTPYAEYGQADYDVSFDHDPLWRYSGNNRLMVLEDVNTTYYAFGCDIQIYEGLELDIYYRKMSMDVEARYYLNDETMQEDPREKSEFPMGHYAWGLGLKYAF